MKRGPGVVVPIFITPDTYHLNIFSAVNPILYNAMSDRFRKSFRSLLVCGRYDPSRQAMAAAMATDMKSEMSSIRTNPHSTQLTTNCNHRQA